MSRLNSVRLQRRQWLVFAAALAGATYPPVAWASAGPVQRLGATWQSASGHHQVGVLTLGGAALQVSAALDVPTRAHGVWAEPGGGLLAVSRRPGDWLLRWQPGSGAALWAWAEPDRAFNGHVIASADRRTLYTTETDLETGQGLIGVRDAASLEKTGEWASHGMDPHELLLDAGGSLLVANGGIPTQAESGRAKLHMERMDSSLVRLDAASGELLGQWRLPDKRLSLRHLTWGPVADASASGNKNGNGQRLLGIAMQAEHDDPLARAAAPVLAVFDGRQLHTHDAGAGLPIHGYGGDIACVNAGFAVSCPRANGVALWQGSGLWSGFIPLQQACALASPPAGIGTPGPSLWIGGSQGTLVQAGTGELSATSLDGVKLDNHWTVLRPAG